MPRPLPFFNRSRNRRRAVRLAAIPFAAWLALASPTRAQGPAGAAPAPTPSPGVVPGAESFARAPRTPLELWDAADYLVGVGYYDQAVPYLNAFLKANPDDATLLEIRDRYGLESVLRLEDSPITQPLTQPILTLMSTAARRNAVSPSRLRRFIELLNASPDERNYALGELRQAGPYAVPPLLVYYQEPARTAFERTRLAASLGRLGKPAVPPLLAALESPDLVLASTAASALGEIGDPRAIPDLTVATELASPGSPVGSTAAQAIARLTGRPFTAQLKPSLQLLTDEAWKYYRHQVVFPADSVEVWSWVEGRGPVPRVVTKAEAEAILGLRFARAALQMEPANRKAQAAFVSLSLARDPAGAFPMALATGPYVLGRVLREALDDGHPNVAVAAALAMGQVADRDALPVDCRPDPLVEALTSPNRRVQFAAARALIELEPRQPFPGSSQVIPILTRFVQAEPARPRAVVIDGNLARGNRLASVLQGVGYDPIAVESGEEGFRQAADSADIEMVFLEPSGLLGAWRTIDTIKNLRADSRTAGLPIFLLFPDDPGANQLHDERAAEIQEEQENNDRQDLANLIAFTTEPRLARIGGSLPDDDTLGDLYRLGTLAAGSAVNVRLELPSFSSLRPGDVTLSIEGYGREAEALASSASGTLDYAIPSTGTYFVKVQSNHRRGNLARYLATVMLTDPTPPTPGTAALRDRLEFYQRCFPRVTLISSFTNVPILKRQIDRELAQMGAQPLTAQEREQYAQGATALLSRIAALPGNPFESQIPVAAPALETALARPATAASASAALADVPRITAQRDLAEAVLDPGRDRALRIGTAYDLARSIQRFGPLLTTEQIAELAAEADQATDPGLRAALASALGALRPEPVAVGRRLSGSATAPTVPAPPSATPAPR